MLRFITVATKPHPMLDFLRSQFEADGHTLTVLGLDLNRAIGWEASGNLGLKLDLFKQFVTSDVVAADDIIVFMDAYDVVYAGNATTLLERFATFGKPIVFGAECDCSPDGPIRARYPDATKGKQLRFLNSGLCMGRTWALRECFVGYSFVDAINDQLWWKQKYVERLDLIELDHDIALFLNCHGLDKNMIHLDNKVATYGDKTPQFLHFNGSAKAIMNKYAKLKPNPYFLFGGATREFYFQCGGELEYLYE
jgi:procollagen-lysine,2-oxoglutarate 5-dioxygenase 1